MYKHKQKKRHNNESQFPPEKICNYCRTCNSFLGKITEIALLKIHNKNNNNNNNKKKYFPTRKKAQKIDTEMQYFHF